MDAEGKEVARRRWHYKECTKESRPGMRLGLGPQIEAWAKAISAHEDGGGGGPMGSLFCIQAHPGPNAASGA
ncbi:hypothetical protein BKA81DRAFT_350590 [Phyllosticta paracitricarpa]